MTEGMATEEDYIANPSARQTEGVGDLFDYGADLNEAVQETAANPTVPSNRTAGEGDASGLGLGLDEEATAPRQRKPVAKLDENR